VTFAPAEWHVVVEAIARGDQVLTLRQGGIDDKPFAVAGSTFWLYPEWEHQRAPDVKRAWHGELARSNRERPTDGTVPIRCRCTVEAAWELTDGERLAALEGWHLWTAPYAASQLGPKPATVLLLRAWALIEPVRLRPDAYAGGDSGVELSEEPPAADLIPALTDPAFDMRSLAVHEALGAPAGVRA
jgi:hypothetical protein